MRAAALAHPKIDQALLHERCAWQSTYWIVRYAIARNPVAPAEVLQRLAGDAHRLVRAAAQR